MKLYAPYKGEVGERDFILPIVSLLPDYTWERCREVVFLLTVQTLFITLFDEDFGIVQFQSS
jgi:hypothetical protein